MQDGTEQGSYMPWNSEIVVENWQIKIQDWKSYGKMKFWSDVLEMSWNLFGAPKISRSTFSPNFNDSGEKTE